MMRELNGGEGKKKRAGTGWRNKEDAAVKGKRGATGGGGDVKEEVLKMIKVLTIKVS